MKRFFLLAVVVESLLAACQGNQSPGPIVTQSTAPPTAAVVEIGKPVTQVSEVLGVWKLAHHPHWPEAYLLLDQEGNYMFSPSPGPESGSEPGQFWFEKGVFMIKDDLCPTPGQYRMLKAGEGVQTTLSLTLIEDNCTARVEILTAGLSTWVGTLQ